jgi:hypothetical protein
MTNATLNMARTTNSYTTIRRAKQLARFPSNTDGLNALGANATDRNLMIVDLLHEAERKFMGDFPTLNVTSVTMTTVAGERATLLDADIRNGDILEFFWDDGSDDYQGQPISLISRQQLMMLQPVWRSESFTQEYPEYACVSPLQTVANRCYLEWFGLPESDLQAQMFMREKLPVFSTSDITTEASTKYISAPDEMAMFFADYLALEFLRATIGGHTAEYATKAREINEGKTHWVPRLANTMIERRLQTMDRGGFPRSTSQKRLFDYNPRGRF